VRRALLMSLSVLAIVGVLHASVPEAQACSGGFQSVDEARTAILTEIELVIIGAIAEPSGKYVQIDVQTVYKGPVVSRITLNQSSDLIGIRSSFEPPSLGFSGPDCKYTLFGDPGERYFLVLSRSRQLAGAYEAGLYSVAISEAIPGQHLVYDAARSLPAGGGPPSETPFPYLPAAVAATLGPLAFLAAAAFMWGRKGGAG